MPKSPPADRATVESEVLDADTLRRWPMPDANRADKYTRGTVLVVGGSRTTPGAVLLAGIAALRMGAGRLRMATDESVATHVAVAVPEAMVIGLPASADGLSMSDELAGETRDLDALVVGPGMAGSPPTKLLGELCGQISENTLLVVDALALGAFAELEPELRNLVAERTIMTPNRQEAAGIAELPQDEDPWRVLEAGSRKSGAVLTSFGVVQAPDGRSWGVDRPSIGLGTSGAGDVLAGLVGGAAARCGDPLQAALWGTFAHMEASRRVGRHMAPVGYLARELLDHVPLSLPTPGD